jgi:hypothetical protein
VSLAKLNDRRLLCITMRSQFRYTLMTDRMSAAMRIAERVYSLAQEQNDAALMLGAYSALSGTLLYMGNFESGRQYAMRGVQILLSGNVQSYVEDFHKTLGAEEIQIEASFGEAIKIAKEQKAISLQKRAEANYAEYHRQKVSGSGGRRFQRSIC